MARIGDVPPYNPSNFSDKTQVTDLKKFMRELQDLMFLWSAQHHPKRGSGGGSKEERIQEVIDKLQNGEIDLATALVLIMQIINEKDKDNLNLPDLTSLNPTDSKTQLLTKVSLLAVLLADGKNAHALEAVSLAQGIASGDIPENKGNAQFQKFLNLM